MNELIFMQYITEFVKDNMTFFIVTCIFILLDILSGLISAIVNRDFSSKTMRKGLGHKLAYIFVMCAVAVLQVAMFDPGFTLDFDFPLFNVVCGFIIFMELSSILENACMLNPAINDLIGRFFNHGLQ